MKIDFLAYKNTLVWKALKIVLFLTAGIISLLLVIVFYFTITDYKPEKLEHCNVYKKTTNKLSIDTISLVSWNIGYFGLNEDMDFFYDGGTKVRAKDKEYTKNINGIRKSINSLKLNNDVLLFQEIDFYAKRSYNINQIDILSSFLNNYTYTYAINYDVSFVPFPLKEPMGKVIAGMATFSKYKINSAKRYALNSSFYWPKQLFMLDRCLLITNITYKNKKVYIINLHNTAYDDNGSIKAKELNQIKELLSKLYDKGNNYVIIGGDWNQSNPKNDNNNIITEDKYYINQAMDGNIFPENWQWAFDPKIPSNRDMNINYQKGKTKTSTIDYFLVSPNIQIIKTECLDYKFKYSDHNPVKVKIVLK